MISNPHSKEERVELVNDLVTLMVRQRQAQPFSGEPNLEPDENGDIRCPSCDRQVHESDFGRYDICDWCERGQPR